MFRITIIFKKIQDGVLKLEVTVVTESDDSYEVRSSETGGRLNKKDGLTRYGNSHVKDKTS